jgi:hypothetical protein
MLPIAKSDPWRRGHDQALDDSLEFSLRDEITATIDAIRTALESAGVEFIAENGGGAGVRLRRPGP